MRYQYIIDSFIETTVSRDILLMKRVDKPALLRRLFDLGCAYSGQVVSYQKLLVGVQGIPLQKFLVTPPEKWLD